MQKEILQQVSSGSMILWKLTSELTMILQNISSRVVGNVLINISPSNIFSTMLLAAGLNKLYQAALAAVSINGLISKPVDLYMVFRPCVCF